MISSLLKVRLVLDTDVLVAALRSEPGASRQLLLAALDQRFLLVASVPLMLEYEAVLTREEQLSAIGLSVEEIDAVLDALASVAEPATRSFFWRPQLDDPGDEMVLETAVNGRADCLVTFNTRHLRAAAGRFGIRTLRPGEIWREMHGGLNEKK